ncbi:hypothetical protein AB832_02230 [Flavobacteriaceae bacterium (ex Bugula neritina AB1)]|nr:hypothetical protein AB832_02230 [Flavobacteriaceae bacterium (ex Bugula neritina AB1)]
MKNILLLIFVAFNCSISLGQNDSREKVKAFKIAHLTEQLNLSSTEAQKFWPIYNDHEKIMEQLRRNERASIKIIRGSNGLNGLSEKKAEELLNKHLTIGEKKFQERRNLIQKLKQVLPNRKILILIKAEKDFNKRLLKQLRHRKKAQ